MPSSQSCYSSCDRSLLYHIRPYNRPSRPVLPRQIIPWIDFPAAQEKIWNLTAESAFAYEPRFPSSHQLDYVRSSIHPISCEHGLRNYRRETVENAVQRMVDAVNGDSVLQSRLALTGTVAFESHTNLGNTGSAAAGSSGHVSIGSSANASGQRTTRRPGPKKGKGNRADQFCIYKILNGANVTKSCIEYKAPHKLTQAEVTEGLTSEIRPDRDVINKDSSSFRSASRRLVAAVITQLFSYMIGKESQYGYIFTGEASVFLYIPEDPSKVYYHVAVPNRDVVEADETRLHRTAAAQVFAFTLEALQAGPPPQSWNDAISQLGIWTVEYDDELKQILPEVLKKPPRDLTYKPRPWSGFQRSPVRMRCRPAAEPAARNTSGGDHPLSPTAARLAHFRVGRGAPSGTSSSKRRRVDKQQGNDQKGGTKREQIQDRPYCTHQCLLGLATGGPVDKSCPNADAHGPTHIGRERFLYLVRAQLAKDRGRDADACALYLAGSTGALFKVRLSAYGYTLVAEGVEEHYLERLQREQSIYDRLRSIQGKYTPVCLGMVDLVLRYYYDGGVFEYFLFLSWAGEPLMRCVDQVQRKVVVTAIKDDWTREVQLAVGSVSSYFTEDDTQNDRL